MEKKLRYYGGEGIDSAPFFGEFEVRFTSDDGDEQVKVFESRDEAEKFYESLDCEKFIWDVTGAPELLHGMTYV